MSGRDASNGAVIEAEIRWFSALLDLRFRIHGGEVAEEDVLARLPPPDLSSSKAAYALGASGLEPAERIILILALLPRLRPQILDSFLIPNNQTGRPFTEFGGAPTVGHSGFRPTRETALFLLAGETMDKRLEAAPLLDPEARLYAEGILELPNEPAEEVADPPLAVGRAWTGRLTRGEAAAARSGPGFPAQRISTEYEWPDLVLPEEVRSAIEEIQAWVAKEEVLLGQWGLRKHLKPGYRVLFHGPPGTGKTVTAAVLGKALGDIPVFRVDLSRVVSKWIGETEKNLGALFDEAARRRMILFFDEADALFGKRGETRSANDRHANQQVSYLLQRIEDSPGLVIMATNLRSNIDAAFARRFQVSVHFPLPDADERVRIWRQAAGQVPVIRGEEEDIISLVRGQELSGGALINVLRSACLEGVRGAGGLTAQGVGRAVERECLKEGRLEA